MLRKHYHNNFTYINRNRSKTFNLYEHILKNIVIEIEQGNYENAIKLYKGMTYGLKVCFGYANKNIDPAIISSKDIKESGHGKVLRK